MALKIETFSSLKGGNSFFKAVTHPDCDAAAQTLIERLRRAEALAVYDPHGFAEGFWACRAPESLAIEGIYVQSVAEIGDERLGHICQPVTGLADSAADLVFVVAFDAARLIDHIRHLVPPGAEIVSLDAMRLEPDRLTRPGRYLDPLNFATNFAFFRDGAGFRTRLATVNYWGDDAVLACTLYDGDGAILARWRESLGAAGSSVAIDSRTVRERFNLGAFTGQLFLHAIGGERHDIVKYALDIIDENGPSLSCTHDANAWPADFYAGLPAPRSDERVVLWVQNSLPIAIPPGSIAINLMGHRDSVAFMEPVPAWGTRALDVATLLPDARWPRQIEISAGKHIVRPRYEITRAGRTRIAHPNVERTDLKPSGELAELETVLGKGFILPAPLLPPDRWQSVVLPTPMATTQTMLPIAATLYDPAGEVLARHRFGALARDHATGLDLDTLLGGSRSPTYGHVELTYDFSAGGEADGWLHALFRYTSRATRHEAETSFGAHIFNSVLTWRAEPQSYAGPPPGLSTRLYLRLGEGEADTLCHLIYPASTPWHAQSTTALILTARDGSEVARQALAIPCGGSRFWRLSELFDPESRAAAAGGYLTVRDTTCRLFGYHGLELPGGRFSLDHMFGF